MADAQGDLPGQEFKKCIYFDAHLVDQTETIHLMFPKIPRKEDLFETLDDLNHDLSRGESYQVQVMKGIHVLATFHEVGHNLRKFVAKQRGQFTFHTVRL
jgi:hypothetical protein